MSDIYNVLKTITPEKARYFKYKFPDLRYDQSRPEWTEESFLAQVARKTMNPFILWEKSSEYKNLVQLYLDSKVADDFKEIYDIVTEQAKNGDDKAIKQFLTLQKEIQSNAKLARKTFNKVEEDNSDDDEFDLD